MKKEVIQAKKPSFQSLYKVIEALMEENAKLVEENLRLKKERANNKLEAPSPIVLRALAIFGD